MIARRERSGQQIASQLISIPNHYTPESFDILWWTRILNRFAPSLFDRVGVSAGPSTPEPEAAGEEEPEIQDPDIDPVDEGLVQLNAESEAPVSGGQWEDYFHRPDELLDLSLWDFFA